MFGPFFSIFKKKWPFLATFGTKIAISQPKRIQIKKKIGHKIRPRNCISKNVMEICGHVNSKNKEINEKVRMRFVITKSN